jgi:hypothetical protein
VNAKTIKGRRVAVAWSHFYPSLDHSFKQCALPGSCSYSQFLLSSCWSWDARSSSGSSFGVIIESRLISSAWTGAWVCADGIADSVGLGDDFDIGTSSEAGLYPGAFLCISSFLQNQSSHRFEYVERKETYSLRSASISRSWRIWAFRALLSEIASCG